MLTTYSIKHIPKRMFQKTWNAFFLGFILFIGGGIPISYAAAPIAGSGTALDFDGVDDHVVITGYQGITGTNARTIEAWIKTTDALLVITSWGLNQTGKKWDFKVNANGLLKLEVKGGNINGSTPVNDGQWHHVACTFEDDGSPNVTDVKLYVDGQLDTPSSSKALVVNTASGSDVRIGLNFQDIYFKGQIDEMRIWNVARTQANIQANMYTPLQGTELGLVAFYDFEEGVGTTATDLTGNHHGTLTNMDDTDWVAGIIGHLAFTTEKNRSLSDTLKGYDYDADGNTLTYRIVDPSQGTVLITDANSGAFTYIPKANMTGTDIFAYQINDGNSDSNIAFVTVNILNNTSTNHVPIAGSGTALNFDGMDDYVVMTGYQGMTGTNARTIEAWVKTTTPQTSIVSWGTPLTSELWRFDITSYGALKVNVAGGRILGSTVINDGQWHHVACTFEDDGSPDVTDVKLYVDGQLETISSSISQAINTVGGSDVTIGYNNISDYFKGQMDEVRIWNIARTEADIQADMYTSLQGTEPGLVVLYDFEDGIGTTATDRTGNHHAILTNMNENDWVNGIIGNATLTTFTNTSLNDTLGGYDIDGDSLTYHLVAPASQGTVSITDAKTGAFIYIPSASADVITGADTFRYQVNDTTSASNIATVTVNIINDIPDNNHVPIAGFGHALDFDGIDDSIVIPNYYGITGTEARTIEAWIKPTIPDSGYLILIAKWGNLNNSELWRLQVENFTGFLKLQVKGYYITGSTPLADGQWHHIACTFENDGTPDVSDVKLYVDGQLETPSNLVPGPINTVQGSEVTIGDPIRSFKGQMDEVRIWNVARTQAQIQANLHHYLSGNEAGLQVYYTFDEGTGNLVTDKTSNQRNGTLTNMDNADWVKRPVSFDTTMNMAVTGILVGTDLDGNKLTYSIVTDPTHGTIQITDPANGIFTYTPEDWYRKADTFTYQVTDALYESNLETVFVNINPTIYSTGAYQNGQNELVELSIPKAQSLIVSISGETEHNRDWLEILQANGTSFNPPKKFSGILDENFVITGSDTIQVLFSSNESTTTKGATVTIDTRPRVLSNDKVLDINSTLSFSETDFADYFIDPIGNGLDTIRIISTPNPGELTLNGSAITTNQTINRSELSQLKYTPALNYTGLDSFLWEGSNGLIDGNSTNQASMNLLVQAFVDLNGQLMDLATAIQQVNSNNAPDNTITFLQDIQLIQSLPVITGTVKFQGNNYSISGNNQHQVFFVDGGTVHFADLTIQDGLARGGDGGNGANDPDLESYGLGGGGGGGAGLGGAIFSNTGSQVSVENVTFLNNQAIGGDGGNGGGRIGYTDGEPGQVGFKQTDSFTFGSGAGGGGSPTGQGSLGGNDQSLGQGGHGNPISNGNAGNSGDSTQMLGNAGGGGGASYLLYGGVGGDGGFGAGSGGSGSHGTDANTVTRFGLNGEFGGQGGASNFQHAGGGGGGAGLGGAIFVRAGSTLTLINSKFDSNEATGGNGGNGTEATYNGTNGQGQGGAIFIQDSSTVITDGDLILTNNTASTDNPDINGLLKPTVSITTGPDPVKETGTLAGTFIISSAVHPEANTIHFSLDGTATLGTDYTVTGATINGTTGTVTIPAMPNNSVTLTITPLDDSDADPDESIQLILNQGTTYQLETLASSAMLTIQDNDSLAFTGLYLESSAPTILNNDELDIVGKLSLYPETGENLAGLPIVLTITAPDGITQETLTTNTLTDTGQFRFDNLSLPNIFPTSMQEGAFGFQVSFVGTDELALSTSSAETILVGASAGYAILVQGKVENEEGLAAHNKTIHRIYKKLRDRHFEEANIQYFNYDTNQPGVDAIPNKTAIASAFNDLQTRMNSNPAPFYIIMVDHGSIDGSFHIYNGNHDANDVITPNDLAGWLNNFEAGLNNNALSKARLVMLGACYSGSFIPELSKTGRIIITSATASEESFKGPNEPDGIRSGEFFMEEFFARLGKNDNIKAAFEFATERTEYFTRKGGTSANSTNRFYDEAVQHPLLDDNGDGQGSNTLSADGDGEQAQTILLGAGLNYDTNALDSPAEILEVGKTVYLNANESSTTLTAQVNNANRVNAVPVDIRLPSVVLSSNGTENSEQLEIRNLPRIFMNCSQATHSCTTYFDQFEEPGMYEAFYFVRDNTTLDISPVKRSVIYKNYANNPAPSAFYLLEPLDGTEHKTNLLFKWDSSTDADGPVTYNFIVAKDASFSEIVYQQEELETAMTYADDTVGLTDQTTYYWKVEAVDPFGERTTSSSVFSFNTNNTNAPPSIASLHVSSAVNFSSLDNAVIDFWQVDAFGNPILDQNGYPIPITQPPVVHQDQGFYNMLLPFGRRRTVIHVDGFEDQVIDLDTSDGLTRLNVEMIPIDGIPTQPGQLQFSATTASVNENEGTVTILVERVDGMDGAISVDYVTNCPLPTPSPEGVGTCDADYTSTNGTLSWSDKDERAKAIYLPIIDDPDFEGDETLTITLSNPTGEATLGTPSQITVTIVDDEATPLPIPGTLQFSSSTYSAKEGDSTLNITVSRINGSDGAVSVQYLVSGTAALNQDYIGGTGTLSWSDGDNTDKRLNLTIIDDDEVEETEALQLSLVNPSGTTLGNQATATLSITDNDVATNAGTLQFETATQTVTEGDESTLIVTRLDGSDGEVSVQYMITGENTATSSDYMGGSGTLTWTDGDDASQSFTIQVVDDKDVEETESIQFTLFSPTGKATLGSPAQATINLIDNDMIVEPVTTEPETTETDFATDSETTGETVTSESATTQAIMPGPAVSSEMENTKAEALDSENTKAEALDSKPKAETKNSNTVLIIDNDESATGTSNAPESEKTGSVSSSNVGTLESELCEIATESLGSGTLQFMTPFYTVNESIGQLTTFTVTRTGGHHGKISVQYHITEEGTAVKDQDYTGGSGQLIWTDGDSTPKAIRLEILDDADIEGLETVSFVLTKPTGGAVLGAFNQRSLLLIADNDEQEANDEQETLEANQTIESTVECQEDNQHTPSTSQEEELDSSQEEKQPAFDTSIEKNQGPDSSLSAFVPSLELGTLPSLGQGMAISKETLLRANRVKSELGITVAFRGGAKIGVQSYQSQTTGTVSQMVKILGAIEIATEHVGQKADILIVAQLINPTQSQFFMVDKQEQALEWAVGDFANLAAALENVSLKEHQEIEIYHGFLPPLHLQIYFGYRLENGLILFNGEQPIEVQLR